MGSARSLLFTVSGVLMIISGAGSMVCAAFMTAQKLEGAPESASSIIINAAIILIFSVINIISGINGVRYYNRRINSAVVIRLPKISIILCLISIILTLCTGTFFGYIILLAGTGILIPAIYIYASVKKSYM